jgi:hypothetical protein
MIPCIQDVNLCQHMVSVQASYISGRNQPERRLVLRSFGVWDVLETWVSAHATREARAKCVERVMDNQGESVAAPDD